MSTKSKWKIPPSHIQCWTSIFLVCAELSSWEKLKGLTKITCADLSLIVSSHTDCLDWSSCLYSMYSTHWATLPWVWSRVCEWKFNIHPFCSSVFSMSINSWGKYMALQLLKAPLHFVYLLVANFVHLLFGAGQISFFLLKAAVYCVWKLCWWELWDWTKTAKGLGP